MAQTKEFETHWFETATEETIIEELTSSAELEDQPNGALHENDKKFKVTITVEEIPS